MCHRLARALSGSTSGTRILKRTWGSLILSSALGLGAVAVVLLTENIAWVVASGAVLGAAQMRIASITSHRVIELAGPVAHTRWWSLMTIGFNVGQAAGAHHKIS